MIRFFFIDTEKAEEKKWKTTSCRRTVAHCSTYGRLAMVKCGCEKMSNKHFLCIQEGEKVEGVEGYEDVI